MGSGVESRSCGRGGGDGEGALPQQVCGALRDLGSLSLTAGDGEDSGRCGAPATCTAGVGQGLPAGSQGRDLDGAGPKSPS